MTKKSFVLYTEYLEQVDMLTDEQTGVLFRAILTYASSGEIIEMDGMTKMAFYFIQKQLDRDTAKYEEVSRKRSEAGKHGGRPKKSDEEQKANAFFAFSEKANESKKKQTKANESKKKQTKAKKPDDDDDDVDDNDDVYDDDDVDDTTTVNNNINNNINSGGSTPLNPPTGGKFAPPTVEDVMGYCDRSGHKIDAKAFVDFYESKGWMVGKNKMKDWKAAVRNWERGDKQRTPRQGRAANAFKNFDERAYDYDDIQKHLIDNGMS